MMYDADLFRAWLEIRSVQALPQEIMARPGVVDRIMQVASTHEAVIPPGPSREELLRMLHSERREIQRVPAEWHFPSCRGAPQRQARGLATLMLPFLPPRHR